VDVSITKTINNLHYKNVIYSFEKHQNSTNHTEHHTPNKSNNLIQNISDLLIDYTTTSSDIYTRDTIKSTDWLVFNGTSTQKGQFVLTAGERNWLSQLRTANEIQSYYLTLHDNNVTQFTVKHSSYTNATTSYLIVWLKYLVLRKRLHKYQARSHTPYWI